MAEQTIYINNDEILTVSDNNYTNTIIQSLVGPEGKEGPVGPAGPPGPRGPRGRAAPFYPRTVYASHTTTLNPSINNVLDAVNASWIKLNTSGNSEFHGIYPGTDGELRILTNTSSNNITIKHESSSVSNDRKIISFNNQDIILSANKSIQLIYDQTSEKWRVISVSGMGG